MRQGKEEKERRRQEETMKQIKRKRGYKGREET
jgi:hypothetical protein